MYLSELIDAVRAERKLKQSGIDSTAWPFLFKSFFIDTDNHADDLLFFVTNGIDSKNPSATAGNSNGAGQENEADILQVFRRGSSTRPVPPISGNKYNWEECTCLNFLLQQVTYELTSAICKRDPVTRKLKVVMKKVIQVYPSPSKRSMEVKMSDEQISYPMLYFSIDNFDDLFEGMVVRAGHDACVELVASVDSIATTIFSGSVTHAQLMASFLSRKSGSKHRSKRGTERTMEFLNMRGPNGVGHAEMAVSRVIAEKNLKGTMSGFLQKLGQCANRLACAQWPKRMHACIVVLP
eukprot:m.94818 g.94818  ORF g.94818 m.94818 type:complete len:295 (-) comp16570_c0_seq4:65-949(-)